MSTDDGGARPRFALLLRWPCWPRPAAGQLDDSKQFGGPDQHLAGGARARPRRNSPQAGSCTLAGRPVVGTRARPRRHHATTSRSSTRARSTSWSTTSTARSPRAGPPRSSRPAGTSGPRTSAATATTHVADITYDPGSPLGGRPRRPARARNEGRRPSRRRRRRSGARSSTSRRGCGTSAPATGPWPAIAEGTGRLLPTCSRCRPASPTVAGQIEELDGQRSPSSTTGRLRDARDDVRTEMSQVEQAKAGWDPAATSTGPRRPSSAPSRRPCPGRSGSASCGCRRSCPRPILVVARRAYRRRGPSAAGRSWPGGPIPGGAAATSEPAPGRIEAPADQKLAGAAHRAERVPGARSRVRFHDGHP